MMPAIMYSLLVDDSLNSPQPHVRIAPLTLTHLCKHSTDIHPTCTLEITLLPANIFFSSYNFASTNSVFPATLKAPNHDLNFIISLKGLINMLATPKLPLISI